MFDLLLRLVGASRDFLIRDPILGLALASAFAAIHVRTLLASSPGARAPAADPPDEPLRWRAWRRAGRFLLATLVVAALSGAFIGLRSHLDDTVARFRATHGRVTEANLDAVRTIWGDEQAQRELRVELGWDTEEIERLEPEDPTMPAVLRKHTVHHTVEENPFVSARHAVTLRRSARTKGSAVYPGYETTSRFSWTLRNPARRTVHARLVFPLPSGTAVIDALSVTLGGVSVLDQIVMDGASLVLERDLAEGETFAYQIAFTSRGLSHWYFQVIEPREIRDFTLTLELPDLTPGELNYPEGCMPPQAIAPTPEAAGSVLTFRLDRAISGKGMGVALPSLDQPGETTAAVLGDAVPYWGLAFAALVLCLALAGARHGPLVALFAGTLLALGWGLVASASDLLFGFWPSAVVVLVPLFAAVAVLVTRVVPGRDGRVLAGAVVAFGLLFPCLAGLDWPRAPLYADLAGLGFVAIAGHALLRSRYASPAPAASAGT